MFYHKKITAVLSENIAQSKRKPITFCPLLSVIHKWETHERQCTIYYRYMLQQSAHYSVWNKWRNFMNLGIRSMPIWCTTVLYTARIEVLAAVLLNIQVCDVMFRWASTSLFFERPKCIHLQDQGDKACLNFRNIGTNLLMQLWTSKLRK